jgi:hypothetical protein
MYDPNIARFISADPLTKQYPWYSPYQVAGNKPIWFTDLDGLEENSTSSYVYHPPVLALKPSFRGLISITDATSEKVHQTFQGNFAQLAKTGDFGRQVVNSLVGSNIGNENSKLDITMTGTRSDISKSWKGTDKNYYNQFSYSFTNNNVTETGTFELKSATIPVSARAWDALAFVAVNKAVSSLVGVFGSTSEQLVISDMKAFTSSATAESRNGLTAVGRALQKHAGREGSSFAEIQFSGKTGNQQGLDVMNEILGSKNQLVKELKNGTSNIFDKTTGRGVNVSRNGTFNGFRDLKQK